VGSPGVSVFSWGVGPPPLSHDAPLCPFRYVLVAVRVRGCMGMHGYAMYEYAVIYAVLIHYAW
jgi:hypothetical protein